MSIILKNEKEGEKVYAGRSSPDSLPPGEGGLQEVLPSTMKKAR
jgi:hypothetical protein